VEKGCVAKIRVNLGSQAMLSKGAAQGAIARIFKSACCGTQSTALISQMHLSLYLNNFQKNELMLLGNHL
jgi:hypothetical protein